MEIGMVLESSLDKQESLRAAYRFFLEEEPKRALAEIKPLLRVDPDDPDLWCALIRPHLAAGEVDLAELALQQASHLALDSPEPWVMQAWIALHLGDADEALDLCEQAKDYATKRAQKQAIRLCQASALYASFQEKLQEILEEYRTSGADLPAKLPCPPELEGLREEALRLLDTYLDKEAHAPEALALKARILSEANQIPEAIALRSQALQRCSKQRTWLHEQAQDYEAIEEYLSAQSTYKRLFLEEEEIIRSEPKEGLSWDKEAFFESFQEVWADIESQLQDDGATFSLTWEILTFPKQDLLSDLSVDEAFDPWSPVLVEVRRDLLDRMAIHLQIFQRNVERIALQDQPPDLQEALYEILEKELLPIFAYDETSEDDG